MQSYIFTNAKMRRMVWALFLGLNVVVFPAIYHLDSEKSQNLIWVFAFVDSIILFMAFLKNEVHLSPIYLSLHCTPFSLKTFHGITEIKIDSISRLTWVRGWRNGPKLEIEFKKGDSSDWVTISKTEIDHLDELSNRLSKMLNIDIGKRWLL